MPTEMIEEWPLPDIFEEGISGEMYPVHLEYQDIGDGVPRFALSSDCGDIPLGAVNVQVSRLQKRIAELEAELIEEMAARMWADEIFRYEGHLTWAEVRESEKEAGRRKARAALQASKKPAAPDRAANIEKALRKILEESRCWRWDFHPDDLEKIASEALGDAPGGDEMI